MKTALLAAIALAAFTLPEPDAGGAGGTETELERALRDAESALEKGLPTDGLSSVDRALERDSKSIRAWGLRARCAEALDDQDARIHALHQEVRLAIAQKRPSAEITELRTRLAAVDAIAGDLHDLAGIFVAKLRAVALQYEKDKRPHSAIRVHKEILALEPESAEAASAVQRLASAPDPSLAGDAKPKDLLAGVSEEWIRAHDTEHSNWKDRAELERDHYVTYTNSGYANLVRAAEAMEQMNAFYREFFQYGTEEDGKSIPRIDLNIFKTRDEYLKLGRGPPVEWSGGHFTGDAVETFIGESGFNGMVGTLFHEAAHQFVSLATGASGWLDEGLASFFEGTRILPNGTVIMNLPANHRLMPMVARLEKGWMKDEQDGIDPKEPSKSEPEKAPTFRIVLENKYEWGPAWYAPTWAVVYFLYNYQDTVDGRYVYRTSFRTFVDKSGGRVGEGAVENFQEVVLAKPEPPIPGVPRPKEAKSVRLPKTTAELDVVWKDWLVDLAKEQSGELEVKRPYLEWARCALKGKNDSVAREHFEKALLAEPESVDVLLEFGAFLSERKGADRASKLGLDALRVLESKKPVDEKAVTAAERQLAKWDPKQKTLEGVHAELWAAALAVVRRYQAAGLPSMAMDLAWRMGSDLNVPGMFELYEASLRAGGRPIQIWRLAYNEKDLSGWSTTNESIYRANGAVLDAGFGEFDEAKFDYRVLTLDAVTSGDWSLEAEVLARRGQVNFCGLAFGAKGSAFHALILFPGKTEASGSREGLAETGFIDLASCFGDQSFKTWRHNPVDMTVADTRPEVWHKLRIDVAGELVDTWFDGELLATQQFQHADPLRGSLGLIIGPGTAKFRNVRFLSRPPRDPAAKIDRAVRMESAAPPEGKAPGGSYLGRVPPFPTVERWVQGARTSWGEKGPVPQLLLLWSTQQNDLVAVDAWVRELSEKHARVGFEVVAIASANDSAAVDAYLKAHALPGSVAVDKREKPGIGDTFETYSVDKFHLPRLLLLGIDGKVVWEGDPGFTRAAPWESGQETFLDAPLAELIDKGQLEALAAWLAKWKSTGAPAIERLDLAAALPVMKAAVSLPEGRLPEIDEARNRLVALDGILATLPTVAASFVRQGVDPAMDPLVEIAKVAKKAIDKNTQVVLTQHRERKASKEWTQVLERCAQIAKTVKEPERIAQARKLLEKLGAMEGRFAVELAADLGPAVEAGDAARIQELAAGAPARPKRWLIVEYLHW